MAVSTVRSAIAVHFRKSRTRSLEPDKCQIPCIKTKCKCVGCAVYLPEKKIPSTQAKAKILSAKLPELQNKHHNASTECKN